MQHVRINGRKNTRNDILKKSELKINLIEER
jgi:hypothetical protein